MNIDRDKFLFIYEQQDFKTLKDSAQLGLIALLEFIEADELIERLEWAAYMLATVFHECAGTWQPIEEYGKGKGRTYGQPEPGNGHVYYGRGYVQLTWPGNYKTIGKILGVDLYGNPDLALVPETAYKIMSYGMRKGTFTGARLGQKINDEKCDYVDARRIINGLDKAELIAGYARKFEHILTETMVKADALEDIQEATA